jgi:PPOX class probable F420-dependent enzyme
MRKMSDAEYRTFMSAGTRTGKVATVRANGRPHVVPIWFLLEEETILFTTWHKTVKADNLRRDPRATLCVDEETPPYAFVMVEGEVAFDDDPAALAHYARRIAARYMGDDLAEQYGARNSVEGELLVRLRPTKIVARAGIAD